MFLMFRKIYLQYAVYPILLYDYTNHMSTSNIHLYRHNAIIIYDHFLNLNLALSSTYRYSPHSCRREIKYKKRLGNGIVFYEGKFTDRSR